MGKMFGRVGSTLLLVASLAMVFAASAMATGEISEYNFSSNSTYTPRELTVGPDGNVWGTLNELPTSGTGSRLVKVTPTGTATEIPSSGSLAECTNAADIVTGSDKNLWFTCPGSKKIVRATTAGVLTYFSMPQGPVTQLARGTEGNLWFAGPAGVGKVTPLGVATNFVAYAGTPRDITVAADGSLWATYGLNSGETKIIRVTTGGVVTAFPLASVQLNGIAIGPDGNIWFTDSDNTPSINKMTPAGVQTTYALPAGSIPAKIAAGPDGNLWSTDTSKGTITRITTSGVMTSWKAAGQVPSTDAIVSGPGGRMWFGIRTIRLEFAGGTLLFPGKIGAIVP